MNTGGGLAADALNVVIRNDCEITAARLAARLAGMPLGLPRSEGCRPTVILFDGARDDDLAAMLTEPAAAIIDVGCHHPMDGLRRLPSGLLVRVSTAMALRRDIAGPLAAALCQRLPQARATETALRATLQEAIGNAVMHGNLALNGGLRAGYEGLADFAHMMEVRAKDPHFAHRPVTIAAKWNAKDLVVTVEDCGAGFDAAGRAACLPMATAACGRGLAQIRAACRRVNHLARGRRISMRFRLNETPR